MKGLDVTVISKNAASHENPFFRIDADFFRKEFLSLPTFSKRLGDIATIRSGTTPPDRDDDLNTGIILLKTTDIRNSILSTENTAYYRISQAIAARMSKTKLHDRDVLINIVGATTEVIGRVAFIPDGFPEANITQAMALVRITDADFEPAALFAFLAGRYGQLQVQKLARPTGQYNLNLQEVSSFSLPRFSQQFNSAIARLVEEAHASILDATRGVNNAEAVMLSALGLGDWTPPEPLAYMRRASVVLAANRIDAEYFHPAKKGFLERLSALPGKRLEAHYRTVREMFDPRSAKHDEVVRNFDLTDALQPVLDDEQPVISASEVGSSKKRFLKDDVVVSRLRSYLREIALVRTSTDVPAVGSSEFIVLRQCEAPLSPLSRAALLVFLRSQPVQTILKWSQDGSHHPRFGDEDLMSIPVPDAVGNVAEKIDELFENTLAARAKGRALLAQARRAVEIAIEKSEDEALTFLAPTSEP